MTFAEEIEKAADGAIEGIVIIADVYGWEDKEDDRAERRKAPLVEKKVLSWEEARPMLDYEYDDGYGGADCDAIWAWSASRVVFVSIYDGATGVEWVPRHPQAGSPGMPGGG